MAFESQILYFLLKGKIVEKYNGKIINVREKGLFNLNSFIIGKNNYLEEFEIKENSKILKISRKEFLSILSQD